MSGHPDVSDDAEQAMDTITAAILTRQPQFTYAQVHAEVTRSYQRLVVGSRITEHLPVLVQHEVLDRLRATSGD